MEDYNLIIGIHSIICALQNPSRKVIKLVGTEDGLAEIKKQTNLTGVNTE
ncbi:MAG: hypothetical protein HON90_10400, partial [Halobacteriovoraceae bacterium]|nr:hypothetical protein [Halobacteriovoraceae bacterium]